MVDTIQQETLRTQHAVVSGTQRKDKQVVTEAGVRFLLPIFPFPWRLISEILHPTDKFVLSIFRLKFQRLELFLLDLSLSVHTENFMRT